MDEGVNTPLIARWVQIASNGQAVDPVFLRRCRELELAPDLPRTLILAAEVASTRDPLLMAGPCLLLGRFDAPEAREFIADCLSLPDPRVRSAALEAASQRMDAWGLRRCLTALADGDGAVRDQAKDLCRRWRPPQIHELLTELIDQGDTASISEAADALVHLAASDYLDLIERALGRVDLSLKRRLMVALTQLEDPKVRAWTDGLMRRISDPDTRNLLELVAKEARLAPRDGTLPEDLPFAHGSGATSNETALMQALLKELVTRGGSDLHVKADLAPYLRRGDRLTPLPNFTLTGTQLIDYLRQIASPTQFTQFEQTGDLDLCIGMPGIARFRLSFLMSRGHPGLVARHIPSAVPNLTQLDLPVSVSSWVMEPHGLILITGPTRVGKSVTLPAMVDAINTRRKGHIVTLEDPLEFVHRDKQCTVTQREIGTDVLSFADGIRFAHRMDPDVIVVDELRDLASIRAAFRAATEGRLVLSTLPAPSVSKAIQHIIDQFPAGEQNQARSALSVAITGIVTQIQVNRLEGGRIVAHEVLVATPAIRRAIREDQPQALYAQMESGSSQGMQTLEQSLLRLLEAGQISRDEAVGRSADPQRLSDLFQ